MQRLWAHPLWKLSDCAAGPVNSLEAMSCDVTKTVALFMMRALKIGPCLSVCPATQLYGSFQKAMLESPMRGYPMVLVFVHGSKHECDKDKAAASTVSEYGQRVRAAARKARHGRRGG